MSNQFIFPEGTKFEYIESPVLKLAEKIFLKSPVTSTYLNDKNELNAVSTIENSIKLAKLFYKVAEEVSKNEEK